MVQNLILYWYVLLIILLWSLFPFSAVFFVQLVRNQMGCEGKMSNFVLPKQQM